MNTLQMSESPNQPTPTRAMPTFYWSVKREVWENKSIYIAPAIVSAVILLGALFNAGDVPDGRRTAVVLGDAHRHAAHEMADHIMAAGVVVIAVLVGHF